MASFDSFDYDIAKRLPEWWKGFGALEPVNQYTQTLIAEILQALLSTMGVVQPLNCWLTIPEEYTWYHHYKATDDLLEDEVGGKYTVNKAITTLFPNNKMHVKLPNTKRNCHAKIKLKLLGTEIQKKEDGSIDVDLSTKTSEIIETLTIQNANQIITLKNISSVSTIEISTETNEILIDGETNDNLIEGEIKKIKPTIKYSNFQEPYIDEIGHYPITLKIIEENETPEIEEDYYIEEIKTNNIKIFKVDKENRIEKNLELKITKKDNDIYTCVPLDNNEEKEYEIKIIGTQEKNLQRYKNIDVEDENKKTEIIINSTKKVNFDLQIYLKNPTYTTEQNIRIATVSAFPLEWVRLYGYFCHPFNNNNGYKFLWEKNYTPESRTTYDRITKQYDCERFYIQVKFQGIGVPLLKGFPQEDFVSNAAFQPNPNLDKWGKVYGLPRRYYRTDITEDEEPFTFPKYYSYPIEQDYWYEERMVNEYRYNDEAVNSLFIQDDSFNNIGMLKCIYPFMDDIWVYTETIDPNVDIEKETDELSFCSVSQNDNSLGVSWEDIQSLSSKPLVITLNPQSSDILKLNDFSYQTKKIKCSFCLNPIDDKVPKDITITGIEVKFRSHTDVQSNTIKLSDESNIIIPFYYKENIFFEKIKIAQNNEIWLKNDGYYTIGGPNELFGLEEISREQLFKGNDGKVDLELGFINENEFIKSDLYLQDITLKIYYKVIPNDYTIEAIFKDNKKEIKGENDTVQMYFKFSNKSSIEVNNKELFIIVAHELEIKDDFNGFIFNLEPNKEFDTQKNMITIGLKNKYKDRTGKYDIIVFCEDKVISNEILVRGVEEE